MPEGRPEVAGTSPVSDPDSLLSSIGDDIVVDASAVCGITHVLSAYSRAERNMERGTAVGSSLATEFFRQISGERQVSAAIGLCRIRKGRPAVLITHGDPDERLKELGLQRDDSVLGCSGENCEEECLERSALVEIL